MSVPAVLKERYRVGPRVGQGGMGEVYKAYDSVLETDAAIKVLGANSSKQALDLFDREWRALRDLHHGNIVSIYDRGEFREGSVTRPYFVMPFLNGRTLYDLIHDPQSRLTVAEVVAIMTKVCEGISAAHGRGIIHRDIKPGNIFVLEGGAVQVIDFGVAHLSDDTTLTTLKGTTPYIAPELLDPDDRRQPSAKTDLFSLAVMCYEALTRIQPFERETAKDTIRAILREIPRPACESNSEVSVGLSQVIQKGMAKSDTSRYATVAELADRLQRALRNEPLPEFDRSTIEPRLRAITDLMARGKVDSANSMLRSIESEGYSDASISAMRLRIEKALEQRTVEHLLETVNSQREAGQYLDALSTLDKALQSMPDNLDALTLKSHIENEWVQSCIASAHHSSLQRDFAHARRLLQDVQKVRPRDTQIIEMLAAVSRAEENEANLRREKEALYQEAQKAFRDGEISSALEKLDHIVQLQNQWNAPPGDRDALYLQFLREVKTEQDRINSAFREVQAHVASRKYSQALAVCDQMLVTNPGHPLFTAARLDIENRDRQVRLDYITEVSARSEAIADLEARVGLLQEALAKYPTESQLQEFLRNAKSKRDLINSAIAYARKTEQRGDFVEAVERWKLVREFHPRHPGVEDEVERVRRRHQDQLRSEHKEIALRRVDQLLEDAAYDDARLACDSLLKEYPNDKQVLSRLNLATESAVHAREAESLLAAGQSQLAQNRVDEAVQTLRRAYELDGRRESIRQNLSGALVEKVRGMNPEEWEAAEPLMREAVRLQPNDSAARSLATAIADRKERALVDNACVTALRHSNNPEAALEIIDEILVTYPANARLLEQREKILKNLGREERVRAATAGGRAVEEAVPAVPEPETAVRARPGNAGLTDILDDRTTISLSGPEQVPPVTPAAPQQAVPAPGPWTNRLSVVAQNTGAWVRDLAKSAAQRSRGLGSSIETRCADLLRRLNVPIQPRAALAGVAAFTAVVLVFGVVVTRDKGRSAGVRSSAARTVAPAELSANIYITPPASELLVDAKQVSPDVMPVIVPAGTRQVEARRPGYKAAVRQHDFQQSPSLSVTLEPLPTRFRFVAPEPGIQFRLDGQERAATAGREFAADDLVAGEHEVEFTSARGAGKFGFKTQPASAPVVSPPPTAKGSSILIATTWHGRGSIRSTMATSRIIVDGQPEGQLTAGALELALRPGVHEIAVEGESGANLNVSVSDQPQVFAAVWSGQQKRSVETRYWQAEAAARAAQYGEALSILNDILSDNPKHERSRKLRAEVLKMVETMKMLQGK